MSADSKQTRKRSLRAVTWVLLLLSGVTLVAIAATSLVRPFGVAVEDDDVLLVYTDFPRRVQAGETSKLRLTLDSTRASSEPFHDVRLRLPQSWLDAFRILDISPQPDRTASPGSGRYFDWNKLGREQPITLTLEPRIWAAKPQLHEWRATLYAQGYQPLERRGTVEIEPRSKDAQK